MNYKRYAALAALLASVGCFASTGMSLEDILVQDHAFWSYIFYAFLAGLGVSFTPCIYPMIPITAGLLHRHSSKSTAQTILLPVSYVLGLSSVYAIIGYVVAKASVLLGTHVAFGQWQGNPVFALVVAFIMFYMAFASLGFYPMFMPKFMSRSVELGARKSSYVYTFFMGALSGTVASPCISPALAALLAFVAKSENPALGLLSLMAFGLGMSVILLVVGTFSAVANRLPRAGAWMEEVKYAMGIALLYVGIGFLMPFLGDVSELMVYGCASFAASAFYASRWVQHGFAHGPRREQLSFVLTVVFFAAALALIFNPTLGFDMGCGDKILCVFH